MNKTKLIYCSSCLAAALPGLAANAASATPETNGNSSQKATPDRPNHYCPIKKGNSIFETVEL